MNLDTLKQARNAAAHGDWNLALKLVGGSSIVTIKYVGRQLMYIDAGGPYTSTICQEGEQEPAIDSWADWCEQAAVDVNCAADGLARCAWCGTYTIANCRNFTCEACDGAEVARRSRDLVPVSAERRFRDFHKVRKTVQSC